MLFNHFKLASLIIAITLCAALTASACENNHTHQHKENIHKHKGYFKPGAAVALAYDYDGQTQPGELEYITLTLEHSYSDGYLSARLLDTPNLQITSHGTLDGETLHAGSTLQLPIQLSSVNAGDYFISLEVVHESLSGEQSLRVLSLPIQIGRSKASKNTPLSTQKLKTLGKKGLITMAAQETIK